MRSQGRGQWPMCAQFAACSCCKLEDVQGMTASFDQQTESLSPACSKAFETLVCR